jgi:hypothetical protein
MELDRIPSGAAAALRVAGLPHREGHVLDAVAARGASGPAKYWKTGARGIESDHSLEVGDGDQQRSVGISVAHHRIEHQLRVGRVGGVEAVAVVHDALEDRRRQDPHLRILTGCS